MKINRLQTFKDNIIGKVNYKICIGAVIVGMLAAGVNGLISQEEPQQEVNNISDMTFEEKDDKYAMLQVNFINTEYLSNQSDCIGFLLDHETLRGGVYTEPGRELNIIPLVPGQYNATSETGATTSFTVEDIDQNFILDMDYATGDMQVHEVEKIQQTK